jgi:hypothetical protein
MQASFPDPTAPNVGGVPQSHNFFHPHFSNHANVPAMSDTSNIGVHPLASITAAGYFLTILAILPFPLMIYWVIRVRFGKAYKLQRVPTPATP